MNGRKYPMDGNSSKQTRSFLTGWHLSINQFSGCLVTRCNGFFCFIGGSAPACNRRHGRNTVTIMQQWTQDEAVAFECAREVITDMMAIQTGLMADEAGKPLSDSKCLTSLRSERSRLAQERAALHVGDVADIARIRAEYGAIVRSWRDERRMAAARYMSAQSVD
jgi:hypothetical protein